MTAYPQTIITTAAAMIFLSTVPVQAGANLYWSGDGTSLGGTGEWNTNNARWSVSAGPPFGIYWTNSNIDTAVFGGAAGTVTLGAPITANELIFNSFSGMYTFSGAPLTLISNLTIGASGVNNISVKAANITILNAGFLTVGSANSAKNTKFVIDGAGVTGGAVVTNAGGLTIGQSASNSTVIVTNGASLYVGGAMTMGNTYYDYDANRSSLNIAGGTANSIYYGSYNQFAVGSSQRSGCSLNSVLVGAGAVVTNVGYYAGDRLADLVIGYATTGTGVGSGFSNRLVVTDGGKLFANGNITAGYADGSSTFMIGNALLVANGGMVNAPGALYVGTGSGNPSTGSYNSVTITNGGRLYTGANSYIGRASSSTVNADNNTALVGGARNGTNAIWDLGGSTLYIGYSASGGTATGNVLRVNTGGVVSNAGNIYVNSYNQLGGEGGTIHGSVTYSNEATAVFTAGAPPLTFTGPVTLNSNTVHLVIPSSFQYGIHMLATNTGAGFSGSFAVHPVIDSGLMYTQVTNIITTADAVWLVAPLRALLLIIR